MKKPLTKKLKEKCAVMITTNDQEEDYMDVYLSIKFLDGTLKDMEYRITIDLMDYKRIGW